MADRVILHSDMNCFYANVECFHNPELRDKPVAVGGNEEAWLDLTGSMRLLGRPPLTIAQEISQRVKSELGVTVSIDVSWNKVFAKFGSDYKKPDAITCITRENYHEIVWNAPAEEMLYL